MKENIHSILTDLKHKLEVNNEFTVGETIKIDKSFFNKMYHTNDIRKSADHISLFSHLSLIKKPVLYWITFSGANENCDKIRSKYVEYKKIEQVRNCSSYKSKFDKISTTLYVGKVKTGFWGRVITHLGYSQSRRTAGLQLSHWYEYDKFSDLTLNYIIFEKEMENLISVIEVELSKELRPILGKY